MSIFQPFFDFYSEFRNIILSIMGLVAVAIVAWPHRAEIKFHWTNFKWSFPLFGGIAKLSRSNNNAAPVDGGLTNPEAQLCSSYRSFYPKAAEADPRYYNNCADYLAAAGEQNRRPMPTPVKFLTALLLFLDAGIFMYLVSTYLIADGTEEMFELGALISAFIVAVILVVLTHKTGHMLYILGRVADIRAQWRDDDPSRRKKNLNVKTAPDPRVLDERLEAHTRKDAESYQYERAHHRIDRRAYLSSYAIPAFTAVLILSIAIGTTVARVKKLDAMQVGEVIREKVLTKAAQGLNESVPADYLQKNGDAEEMLIREQQAMERFGSWFAFGMLAVLYIGLQVVAIVLGHAFGFASQFGQRCWEATHRFQTEDEFKTYHDNLAQRVNDAAQSRLAQLQTKIADRAARISGNDKLITFLQNRQDATFQSYLRRQKNAQYVVLEEPVVPDIEVDNVISLDRAS